MTAWRVIWVGKSQHRFVDEGIEYYRRLIVPLRTLELVEVRSAAHSGRDAARAIGQEGEAILKRVGREDIVILLDEKGPQRSTRELAQWLRSLRDESGKPLCFVVGGAYGVDEAVRERANHLLSLSKLTLPHQLARVVLLEQIFRVLSLLAGKGYHHD